MNSRFAEADYQLLWPRALFVQVAAKLLNSRELNDWDDRCELLLEDAFIGGIGGGPLSEFREVSVLDEPRSKYHLDGWDLGGTSDALVAHIVADW